MRSCYLIVYIISLLLVKLYLQIFLFPTQNQISIGIVSDSFIFYLHRYNHFNSTTAHLSIFCWEVDLYPLRNVALSAAIFSFAILAVFDLALANTSESHPQLQSSDFLIVVDDPCS